MQKKVLIGIISVFILMFIFQIIIVRHDNPAILNEPAWDSQHTKKTFMKACADCHSNETKWKWYSYIPPVSFLVYYDVIEARENFNISEYRKDDGIKSAYEFKKGEMPLRIYTLMHTEAVISGKEKQVFYKGLESTFGKYTKEKLERNSYSHPEE